MILNNIIRKFKVEFLLWKKVEVEGLIRLIVEDGCCKLGCINLVNLE